MASFKFIESESGTLRSHEPIQYLPFFSPPPKKNQGLNFKALQSSAPLNHSP